MTEIARKHPHLYCQTCQSLLLIGKQGALCPFGHGRLQILCKKDRATLTKLWKETQKPQVEKRHPALRSLYENREDSQSAASETG